MKLFKDWESWDYIISIVGFIIIVLIIGVSITANYDSEKWIISIITCILIALTVIGFLTINKRYFK